MEKKEKDMFSENTDDHNFQTMHMENKLKNIKKKRKNKKVKQNFKNIETFDVLINTNSENRNESHILENTEKKEKIIEGIDGDDADDGDGDNDDDLNNRENRDNYEGHDPIKDPKNKKTWKELLTQYIEDAYAFVNISDKLGPPLMNALKDGKGTKKDEKILTEYISYILTAFASVPITYNWYFMAFYSKANENIKLFRFNPIEIRDELEKGFSFEKVIYVILFYLFEFSIWYPYIVDYVLIDSPLAKFFNDYIPNPVKFISLYLVVFVFVKFFLLVFKETIISFLNGTPNPFVAVTFTALIIFLFMSYIARSYSKIENFREKVTQNTFIILFIFIRVIIVLITSVPLAAVLLLAYLLFNSFFVTLFCYDKQLGLYITILELIKDTNDMTLLPRSCNLTMFEIIVKYIALFLEKVKSNIHIVASTLLTLFFLSTFYYDLSDVDSIIPGLLVKYVLISMLIPIALMFLGFFNMYILTPFIKTVMNVEKDV
jgi:hypothetical protein